MIDEMAGGIPVLDLQYGTYFTLSLIPIVFQSFVLWYVMRLRKYIGGKSSFIMIMLSVIGLAYDFIITGSILFRIGANQQVTILALFYAFGFPIARSGLMLWLMRIMASGLLYHGRKKTKPQEDSS